MDRRATDYEGLEEWGHMETFSTSVSFEQGDAEHRFDQIIGNSAALKSVLGAVGRVAPTNATVLVLGETGTGKELIAAAIHKSSPRCAGPFVKINCAAIPFELLESELFGYEKGAFTGAFANKIGRLEMADGGTLFLDEIGDIPLALQPKLLRVLQEKEFERLGSGKTHRIDVRLIAATHRNLTDMVARNQFRSDLYYRLNVFPIVLPPMRERREDIALLASHFVEIFSRRMGKPIGNISKEMLDAFTAYSWPGNVRELQNLIERAVILSENGVLANPLPQLDGNVVGANPTTMDVAALLFARDGTFRDSQRALILRAIHASGWILSGPRGAAARLGLKRTTLISKMRKLGISRPVRQLDSNELNANVEIQLSSQSIVQ
jgi:formate hydrogenlyase transcriptional activator